MDTLLSSLITYLQENYRPTDTLPFTLPSPVKKEKPLEKVEKKIPRILLLTHPREKGYLSLLTSLASAIETTFAPCAIVDIQEETNFITPSLALLLLSKTLFFQSPHLLSAYHRGTPPTLFNIPLILLSDLALLSAQKEEKKNLWNQIKACNLPQ